VSDDDFVSVRTPLDRYLRGLVSYALVVGLRHPGRHEGPLEGADGTLPGSDPTP